MVVGEGVDTLLEVRALETDEIQKGLGRQLARTLKNPPLVII